MRVFQTSFYPSVLQRVRSHLLSSEMNDGHVSAMKSFGKRPSTDDGGGDGNESKTSTST